MYFFYLFITFNQSVFKVGFPQTSCFWALFFLSNQCDSFCLLSDLFRPFTFNVMIMFEFKSIAFVPLFPCAIFFIDNLNYFNIPFYLFLFFLIALGITKYIPNFTWLDSYHFIWNAGSLQPYSFLYLSCLLCLSYVFHLCTLKTLSKHGYNFCFQQWCIF